MLTLCIRYTRRNNNPSWVIVFNSISMHIFLQNVVSTWQKLNLLNCAYSCNNLWRFNSQITQRNSRFYWTKAQITANIFLFVRSRFVVKLCQIVALLLLETKPTRSNFINTQVGAITSCLQHIIEILSPVHLSSRLNSLHVEIPAWNWRMWYFNLREFWTARPR